MYAYKTGSQAGVITHWWGARRDEFVSGMLNPLAKLCKGKGKVVPVLNLIKHYAMKAYGGVDV
jgi:hypothetical protein